ncbi:UvrD-helicase domain-containing protein, partial [Bifidobacterium pseudocatenulatum]|uniref:UvrD-helicase domain-containing protein n=1 Tax=Bifidobacterium pseudocatenulatum TaxID=28026 RepID=UPI002FE48997
MDYKTGRTPTVKQIFNDLQLVCYQLGLVFPEDGPRGAKALAAMPHISQSALFHVGQNAAPARSYAPEGAFQPPLFTDGSLNAEPFTPRYWYKDPNRFFDIPAIDPATPPEGVSAEAWAQFAALAGTQTLWSLTMIARVFYAAAASRSAIIEAHPQDTHIGFCRMKNVCPPVDADVLVVAGAGSGKTFTMTQRIIALINRGVAPERILGLTFTRKAAGELLERVSAAVAGDMAGSTTATVSDRAFLKPAIFTYDAFFQTIVRQYGLLVGFDQNTQPLSAAGALQLAAEVIDSHMDLAFSEDFGAFSSLANRVLALSDAIGSAMIGAGCTSFDDAINRVRQWDSA